MKARAAIASMQKLLQRGNRKIRRLNEEEIVKLRKRRAQKTEKHRKELALKLEIKRMEQKRLSSDASIRAEGELEDMHHDFQYRRHYDNHPYTGADHAAPRPSIPTTSLSGRPQPGTADRLIIAEIDVGIETDAGISAGI